MKRINNLLNRRWLTIYACALYVTLLGVGLSLAGSALSYVLMGLGVAVMFCVLITVEWRGIE